METAEHKDGGTVAMNRAGELLIFDEDERERYRYNVPYGSFLKVKDGQKVNKNHVLFEWDPYNNVILAPKSGRVDFSDLVDGETLREAL